MLRYICSSRLTRAPTPHTKHAVLTEHSMYHTHTLTRTHTHSHTHSVTELASLRDMDVAAPSAADVAAHPKVQACIRNMQSLIGYFQLDPNKVLALVLQCAEEAPFNAAYLAVTSLFRRTHVPNVIGFAFQSYAVHTTTVHYVPVTQADASNIAPNHSLTHSLTRPLLPCPRLQVPEEAGKLPRSLVRLTARLLADGVLELEQLLPHLADNGGPGKDAATLEALVKATKSYGTVNLAATAKVMPHYHLHGLLQLPHAVRRDGCCFHTHSLAEVLVEALEQAPMQAALLVLTAQASPILPRAAPARLQATQLLRP